MFGEGWWVTLVFCPFVQCFFIRLPIQSDVHNADCNIKDECKDKNDLTNYSKKKGKSNYKSDWLKWIDCTICDMHDQLENYLNAFYLSFELINLVNF